MSAGVERRHETATGRKETSGARPQHPSRPAKPMNAALLFAIVALAITVVGLLYLIQTAQVASLGYEITRLERERAAASLENQQLTHAVASFESLPRIEQIAVDTQGMQPIANYVFLTVPLPPRDEQRLPHPVEQPNQSLALRVWERLTGQATATNGTGR